MPDGAPDAAQPRSDPPGVAAPAGAALTVAFAAAVGDLSLDVSLKVQPGRPLALAGPSGAGKTSVLRAIAGLARPPRGHVRCGERTWLDTGAGIDLAPEERRCGVVFQDYALFAHLDARGNVAYGLRGLPRAERRRRADALLERFGLAGRARAMPSELSGGERQRVALARAVAIEPRALLLDEPLAALDPRTRAAARRELASILREAAVPVLLVTHDFAEAALLAHEVAVMDAGRIVQRGTPAALAAAPASAFVADLTGASVLHGTARARPDGLTAVTLDGGGEVVSTDPGDGRVAVGVFPWDVSLEPAGTGAHGSARNRLPARVATVTVVGNRVRAGLETPQPLAAELTGPGAAALDLAPGAEVVATWKATATRLVHVDASTVVR
jgi:molybdate transport system ATP-binding protein